jgi:DNA-binding NarL/FixJ family response regulator
LGDDDIRAQIREALQGTSGIDIVGELCAFHPRHADHIADMQPDVAILDCASRSINPLVAIAELRQLAAPPSVIALLEEGGPVDFRAASRLGADAIVTTTRGLIDAVLPPTQVERAAA